MHLSEFFGPQISLDQTFGSQFFLTQALYRHKTFWIQIFFARTIFGAKIIGQKVIQTKIYWTQTIFLSTIIFLPNKNRFLPTSLYDYLFIVALYVQS